MGRLYSHEATAVLLIIQSSIGIHGLIIANAILYISLILIAASAKCGRFFEIIIVEFVFHVI